MKIEDEIEKSEVKIELKERKDSWEIKYIKNKNLKNI